MRTIVKDHNKKHLAKKVFRMVENGWEPLSKITYDDLGMKFGTISYYCVMEHKGEDKPQHNWNHPWGA